MTSTTEQMHEAYLKWVDTLPVDNDNRSYVVRSCMAPDKSFDAGYQAAHSELLPVIREARDVFRLVSGRCTPEVQITVEAIAAKLNEILGGE